MFGLRWAQKTKPCVVKFDVFGHFYLRERIYDPVSVTRIAFKDKIMVCRISLTSVLSLFIHNTSLKDSRDTTASNLFQASLLIAVRFPQWAQL